MNHMNLLPLDSHGVDFSRVRMWSLNNWSKFYRQTLLFGALQDAQINSVFSKYCVNAQGQVGLPLFLWIFLKHVYLVNNRNGLPPNALIDSWQVAVRNVPMTGSISHVLVQLPHVFQKMEAENLASVIDARYPPLPSLIGCLGASQRDLTLAYKFKPGFHAGFFGYHLPNELMNPIMPSTEEETEAQREMVLSFVLIAS